MTKIDKTSSVDITSRLNVNQAKKVIQEFINSGAPNITFTKHSLDRMAEKDIETTDVLNVLRAGFIYDEPEEINSSFRYRIETSRMLVVVALKDPDNITIVTAWRKDK